MCLTTPIHAHLGCTLQRRHTCTHTYIHTYTYSHKLYGHTHTYTHTPHEKHLPNCPTETLPIHSGHMLSEPTHTQTNTQSDGQRTHVCECVKTLASRCGCQCLYECVYLSLLKLNCIGKGELGCVCVCVCECVCECVCVCVSIFL